MYVCVCTVTLFVLLLRGDVASKTNFFINVLFVMKFGVCMWMIVRIPNMKTVFKYLLYFLSYKHNYTN